MKIIRLFLSFFFFFFFFCRSTDSVISSSPGLQRRNIGDFCQFQWTINGQISKYEVLNTSTTTITPLLSDHSNHSITSSSSSSSSSVHFISLFIWDIHLWDAGNYTLSVTLGTTTTADAGALLFVFDNTGVSSVSHSGTLPVPETGSVVLLCSASTDSRPSSHRPLMRYFWETGSKGGLTSDTDGQTRIQSSGEILRRYSITDNGRNLTIEALQFSDQDNYFCRAQEDGSLHRTGKSSNLYLLLNHRPMITDWNPPSRTFSADVGLSVTLTFSFASRPTAPISLAWKFTDVNGTVQAAPSQFQPIHSISSPFSVTFTLTSDALYGRYSFEISNAIGNSSGFFNVLPPGSPDTPSALTVRYKTFRLMSVEWKCRWYNGRQQTAMLQVKDPQTNEVLDTFNRTEDDDRCYNSSRNHLFHRHLQPDRDYEIRLWSENSLGSSDDIKTTVRTTKRFQLLLSHETISIGDNEAKISFETRHGNMAALHVTGCAEEIDECTSQQFQVNTSSSYVILKDLAPGMAAYLFDFKAFGKAPGGEEYFLGIIKGVRVPEDEDKKGRCYVAVVVLGCVLAIALIAFFASLSYFVFVKIRGKEKKTDGETDAQESNETELKPRKTKEKTKTDEQRQQQRQTNEQQRRPLPDPKTPRKSQVPPPRMPPPEADNAQETYEAMERAEETTDGDDGGEMYTPLDQPQSTRKQKRNLYS